MQHQRNVQRIAQLGDAFNVQLGGGLFLVQQVVGDRAMHAADGHAQPVALGLAHKLLRLVHAGKAHLLGKDLFVGNGGLLGLMAHHRAQLGFHRNASRMRHVRHGASRFDIALQRQAGAVHHHGAVAGADGALDDRHVVHFQVILIDHRHMIQVQQRVSLYRILRVFLGNVFQALRFELFPLQTRHLNHGHAVLIYDGLHDGLEHRRMRNVKGGDHETIFKCLANNNSGIHCIFPPFSAADKPPRIPSLPYRLYFNTREVNLQAYCACSPNFPIMA